MKIALVGNQNSGKTTLFNLLTGSNQKIGNWPGVTIERKSGTIRKTNHELVDLPGIYSLSPYTPEEEVSRKFVLEEKPDLIINIVDVTSLERSLYLTTQLLELDCSVILALNMVDILDKKGLSIQIEALAQLLDVDIIPISALKKTGIQELITVLSHPHFRSRSKKALFNAEIEQAITKIEKDIPYPHRRFVAVKVLERDPYFKKLITSEIEASIQKIEKKYHSTMEEMIADYRYRYIVSVKKQTIHSKTTEEPITDRLDRIFLHKWLALPIFALIMFLVYYLSVGVVGSFTVDWIGGLFEKLSIWLTAFLEQANASDWSISLVVDGIVAGVGAVLGFIPQLMILFFCISILETSGYMSRIAFFLDRIFKHFGLSGKALIPFIVGSGCSVPGIMATRTIDDNEERRMAVMLTPFVPCSAKLPIIALFSGFFFPRHAGMVSASLYFLAILVILFSAVLMKKFFFRGKRSAFVSELPAYKLPNPRYVFRDVFDHTWEFMKRAGTIILLCSVIIWFMLSFSWRFEYGIDVEKSILASVGNLFSWIFYPMLGELSWGATISAIQGLVAKEQVVSSMAVIAGLASDVEAGNLIFNPFGIFGFFTGASAYAFMVFNLFSAPCFGAIGAMHRELGTMKKTLIALLYQTGLAWLLATLFYWVITGIGVII